MRNAIRLFFRLITLVLGLSVAILVLAGGFWYVYQDARGRTPQIGYTITAKKLSQAGLGIYLRYRGNTVDTPADPADGRERVFVVEPGETVNKVAQNLQRAGLVKDGDLFRRVVQYLDADQSIDAGVYALRPNMTMREIAQQLQYGRIASLAVTIPEGWRAEEIAALLEELGILPARDLMRAVGEGRTDPPFLVDRRPGSPASLEGFLFPDTYQFPKKSNAKTVIDIMLQNWERRVTPEMRQKAAARSMTIHEVLTLASIVEREAVVADERAKIAGVYHNRLNNAMLLQSDPTVQYAKGYSPQTKRWWNPMIQEEARTVVSPYNTFLNPGLPPTPICNPGLASIAAALEPEAHSFLFFFAKGDGSHVFATTYEQHLKNQKEFGSR